MKLLLLFLIVLVNTILARPQLDLPPLDNPPPLQIFVPDLQFELIKPQSELQPAAAAVPSPSTTVPPPPPPTSSQPPPQPVPVPQPSESSAPINNYYNLKFNSQGEIEGYSYQVETSDGFQKLENGEIREIGNSGEGVSVSGRYAFIGPGGKRYNVVYTADENGFRPTYENGVL